MMKSYDASHTSWEALVALARMSTVASRFAGSFIQAAARFMACVSATAAAWFFRRPGPIEDQRRLDIGLAVGGQRVEAARFGQGVERGQQQSRFDLLVLQGQDPVAGVRDRHELEAPRIAAALLTM